MAEASTQANPERVQPNAGNGTAATAAAPAGPPEYNVTGQDYCERSHFCYSGSPLIDIHSHIMQTRPNDPVNGPPLGTGPGASLAQAETFFDVAAEFGVGEVYSMCPADDIGPLRERFGARIHFNGPINKKLDEPDDAAYRLLDRYLSQGVEILKYWSAPRGRERGLFVDAPWRIEATRRGQAAGIRFIMVHVSDPDVWFKTVYADSSKFGTKLDQYAGLERMLQLFPDLKWIGAHMGGDPEHADHLEALLERYPHLYFDMSATKWQVREVSAHREAIRSLICRRQDRFLLGSDLVTRHHLVREHYVSRYWCLRSLWESGWEGPSPIADPDFVVEPGASPTPILRGLALPAPVLQAVYHDNVKRLFAR
jgi:hypothetical protein